MAVPTGTSLCMQSESQMLLTSELSVGELSTSVAHCVLRHQAVSCLALAAAHAISTHAASYTAANDPRQAAFRHSKSSICQAKMWSVSALPNPHPAKRQLDQPNLQTPDTHLNACLAGISWPPACPPSPENRTRRAAGAAMAVTTPSCRPSASSRGPCSMCSSTKALIEPALTRVRSRMACVGMCQNQA